VTHTHTHTQTDRQINGQIHDDSMYRASVDSKLVSRPRNVGY